MNPAKLRTLTKMKSIRRRESGQSMHNSFTDLAAQISRIPIRHHGSMLSLNDVGASENESSSDWYEGKFFNKIYKKKFLKKIFR